MKYMLILACCCLGFGVTAFADAPPVLYLAAPGQFTNENPAPMLVRELARQSLLIAARDELGLYTRDGLMREWKPDAHGNPPADVQGKPALLMDMHASDDSKMMHVNLYTIGPSENTLLLDPVSTPVENGWISVPLALETIEPLSRGRYLDQLKKLGFQGDVKPKGDQDIPDGVDHLLYQTTLLAPFSALQQVHAAIHESGESPARLSALVRGYANLGQLTRFQWSSIHKVMTARSLLYAQRMVNEDPDSPFALYNRAYAYAMTGLHAAALADLEQARQHEDELTTAGKPVPAIPRWVALLDPFCKYDVKRLAELAPSSDPRSPLASLMVFIDVENCGSLGELMGIGNAALITDPSCFRIMDGMMAYAGVISGHDLTERAPQVMLDNLPDEIKLLTAIPKATQQALNAAHGNADHVANLTAVSKSFIDAPESAEPSFTLAGRIIQETNFIHVMRRAVFLADSLSVDCSDYVNGATPLVADHPYFAYVQSLKLPYQERTAALKSLEISDPQWQMNYMLGQLATLPRNQGHMTGQVGWMRIHRHPDPTADDAERMLLPVSNVGGGFLKDYAPRVLAVSPYSALAAGTIVKTDFKAAEPNLDEWGKRFADQPAFLSALATHWLSANDPGKAEPLLKQLVEVAPDREYVEMLGKLYLARNDEADWLSTMKVVLAQPDYRLDHSVVESEIAWHYMSTGKYDIARSYADASYNDSGSAWSMECDEFAAELQGDFATSEKVAREEADRYTPMSWFYWCKRTGHGDVAGAQKIADNLITAGGQQGVRLNVVDIATVRCLENNLDEAKKYYDQGMREQKSCFCAMQLALIGMQQKDSDARDAALVFGMQKCLKDIYGFNFKCYADYAKLVLAGNGQAAPTEQQVEQLLTADKATINNRAGVYYFRGKQLQINGDTEGAKKCFLQAVQTLVTNSDSYVLASDALHQLGEPIPLPKIEK